MRNSAEIKVWMLRNGHTMTAIKDALGYTNLTQVSLVIAGKRDTPKVLEHLRGLGCPEQLLNPASDREQSA